MLALEKGAEAFTAFPGSLGCNAGSNVVKTHRPRQAFEDWMCNSWRGCVWVRPFVALLWIGSLRAFLRLICAARGRFFGRSNVLGGLR